MLANSLQVRRDFDLFFYGVVLAGTESCIAHYVALLIKQTQHLNSTK